MEATPTWQDRDPRRLMAETPMRLPQYFAIGMCVLLTALDGFDVLSISFASPGIAKEWGVDRAALGVVLSTELIGMAAGAVLLGQMADLVGRRVTTFLCLSIMALGMLSTTQAGTIEALAATRLFTGIGIGGMLATANALVAEYASDRARGAAISCATTGRSHATTYSMMSSVRIADLTGEAGVSTMTHPSASCRVRAMLAVPALHDFRFA